MLRFNVASYNITIITKIVASIDTGAGPLHILASHAAFQSPRHRRLADFRSGQFSKNYSGNEISNDFLRIMTKTSTEIPST